MPRKSPKQARPVAPHFARYQAPDGADTVVFGPGLEITKAEFSRSFRATSPGCTAEQAWDLLADAADNAEYLRELQALEAQLAEQPHKGGQGA